MQKSLSFLFGKEVASRMQALEEALQVVERKHQHYFASRLSRYAAEGETRAATLAEFVQPRWRGPEPTLEIDSGLPLAIAAECLACVAQLPDFAPVPTPGRRVLAKLRALVRPAKRGY
ncbi:MAG: hypothetical protein EOO60_00135 [Hymenobacter sp.]|nr:MAG: hypothetical protein EOO60_00135 [Hymenobacter sp.]